MKVLDLIKNLFAKKANVSTNIVNIRDTIHIRSRDELSLRELENLEKYKNEYLSKLKGKILFSKDLDIISLKKDMDMYLELIVNLFLKENSAFECTNEYNEQLNLMIKAKKKDLYLQNVLYIIKEIELRIIALEEILKSTNSFNLSKKQAIKNKLENLVVMYKVFNTQGEAIFIDANANIEAIKTMDVLSGSDTEALNKRALLEKMYTTMMPTKIRDYKSISFRSIYEEIAFLEKELEIEVYKHKDIIPNLEERLHKYSLGHGTLEELSDLELRIRVFYDYGRDLVSDKLLKELYRIKFNVLTKNLAASYDKEKFQNFSYVELEQYKEIIFEKISDILTGKNEVLKNLLGEEYNKYVKLIINILKDGEKEYDWYKILNSRFLLSFLVSLDNENSIVQFFKHTKEKRSHLINDLYFGEDIFKWDQEIPLETLSILMDFSVEKFDILILCKKLLSSIKNYERTEERYYLPEGIVEINCSSNTHNALLDFIRKNSKNKIVYMPSTLKYINGDIFDGTQFKLLVLNEGLIGLLNFPGNRYDNLNVLRIPSTLKVIGKTKHNTYNHFDTESIINLEHYSPSWDFNTEYLIFEHFDVESDITKILWSFFRVECKQVNGEDYINLTNNPYFDEPSKYSVKCTLKGITFESKFKTLEVCGYNLNNFAVEGFSQFSDDRLKKDELNNLVKYIKENCYDYLRLQ